ncbi:MAG: PIN domain-containing protein [Chloroflexi bacterium]|nr:PIN domain-containing protein [Chloroflexota bacterium]
MGVARFLEDIVQHRLALLDTMVFIYLLEEHPVYASLAATVLEAIETEQLTGVTSTLTLTELLMAPAQVDDAQAMQDYELYLTHFPNLIVYPLDVEAAREAARVRAMTGLPTPDAIQLATATVAGADVIITNDKRWQGKVGDLHILLLDDYVER